MSAFSFVALGDMPYRKKDLPAFDRLTAAINDRRPRFVVHLGDMKSGRSAFKKNTYVGRRELFSEFAAPFIFTPGDNDWVDGDGTIKELASPASRLKELRRVFFDDAENSIDAKLWIIRQDKYVENAWWTMDDMLFVTLHTIGNNNNRSNNRKEFAARNKANLDWLDQCVGEAPHRGIVIFTHANLWHPGRKRAIQSGFAELIDKIGRVAQQLEVPVLVMHGDKHEFVMDHPVANISAGSHLSGLTRIQVMGDSDVRAVEVTVSEDRPISFSVHPITP